MQDTGIREGFKHAVVGEGCRGQHAAQAGGAGSPQKVHQHRLGLVVGVVADRDLAGVDLRRHARQECIAHAPGCLLEGQPVRAGQCRHVLSLDRGGELPLGGDL